MPTSRGLALNGKFALTYFYEYTSTPPPSLARALVLE